MKLSQLMHLAGILIGIAGGLALIGAWIAGESSTFLGLSQEHLYWDAFNLQLIAISAGICVLYRNKIERENPGQFL